MQATGIIVEYNPLHLGHLHHIKQTRKTTEADCIIAVMSGPFLQRGEPAIIDKWERTKTALEASVDLVVELPHLFAVQHGDYFSKGAVETLANLHVSSICFGSEQGTIEPFLTAHKTWEDKRDSFDSILTSFLEKGNSYPESSRLAYEAIGISEIDLSRPNNILGYSYVKAINRYAPSITPETITRVESDYHDETIEGTIASATSIRKNLHKYGEITKKASETLPTFTSKALQAYRDEKQVWHSLEIYFPLIQHLLWTSSPEELRMIQGVDEGLEHRLLKAIDVSSSFHDLMHTVKTKRYTWTRLQRLFIHLLTNIKKTDSRLLEKPVSYVRVLGMNDRGREYLSQHKKDFEVPVVTQLKQLEDPLFTLDLKAQKAYLYPLSGENRVDSYRREKMPPVFY
ncbi:nucleotidyltransferase [Salimicrobium flavidum]|uniref:tRNA(Met) cytidine acetate ligase n=1 Tax=Salimicrobium flavidum TaxID=570947 RepID=A0A1N7ILN0_9BACI|nr:nucleotidyltransferase [Salimicrobium flavidum]SIS37979.1 Predicted nucleotidyltransferase [Salimicrobium flavidum]